jgi:DNA repair exonuclease SbcCD ATPase subunit
MDQVVKYDVTDAIIAEMKSQYMGLTIQGIDDKEGYEMVHKARMVVKGKRVEVEKKRKELNKEALAWQKSVNAEAKRITDLLRPIENHLKVEENIVTEEKNRIKEEKERKEREKTQARIDELAKLGAPVPFFEIAALSNEEFAVVLDKAIDEHRKAEAQKAKEEAEQKEKAEAECIEREKMEAKLKAGREELEKLRQAQATKDAELKAEQKRLEDEKQAFEDAKRKAAEEEADKKAEAEREARREALKPDREKLLALHKKLNSDFPEKFPEVESEFAQDVLDKFEVALKNALADLSFSAEFFYDIEANLKGGHHDRSRTRGESPYSK